MKTGFQAGDFLEGAYIEPHPTAKREGEEYRFDFGLQQVCNVLKKHLENLESEYPQITKTAKQVFKDAWPYFDAQAHGLMRKAQVHTLRVRIHFC